jgi:hypothetical protein
MRGCGTQHPRSAANYSWALPPGLVLDSLGKAGRLELKPSKGLASRGTSLRVGRIPRPRRAGARANLALPFTHLLKSFRVRDPAPEPQVALSVYAIDLAAAARNNPYALPRKAATAHLIVMAFYFQLRVVE